MSRKIEIDSKDDESKSDDETKNESKKERKSQMISTFTSSELSTSNLALQLQKRRHLTRKELGDKFKQYFGPKLRPVYTLHLANKGHLLIPEETKLYWNEDMTKFAVVRSESYCSEDYSKDPICKLLPTTKRWWEQYKHLVSTDDPIIYHQGIPYWDHYDVDSIMGQPDDYRISCPIMVPRYDYDLVKSVLSSTLLSTNTTSLSIQWILKQDMDSLFIEEHIRGEEGDDTRDYIIHVQPTNNVLPLLRSLNHHDLQNMTRDQLITTIWELKRTAFIHG